ncbi:PREDICTED: 50S ribosomal protein L31, chloroplastic-like [Camelina sativa]|uniref:Large ribosomal subunit protein bL31c n=1 Tax=Camelina sativa TaxID=90675 RepID=A0ABM0SUQ4_CAMSA|nr:PREDICTED: 50S ribosomal protein L31, chloroplastic-like [Camelina sativa]
MAVSLPNSFLQINPCVPSMELRKPAMAALVGGAKGKGKQSARSSSSSNTSVVQITCRKKDLHPEFHEDAKVYCNGELVMTTGGTKKEYVVDVWSGNHPFYLGNRSALMVDADQVEKFRKRFAGLSEIMEIPVLKGEIVMPTKKGKGPGKGKKK